ncbi:sensor histidine kinase [Streptomyces avicenniae]|uniref:sensor histidine kinase n=1 Tax=Streptomyces avicenniae TaxID=500153 RepID=UPI00069C4F8F|nr:histidine kinase [Streptomyces avicenniae]
MTRTHRQNRITDVIAILLALGLGLLFAAERVSNGREGPAAVFALCLVLSVVGCVALWWRRDHPVRVALLLLPLTTLIEYVGGASIVILFTVAVHRPWRTTMAIAAAYLAGTVPYALLWPDPDLAAAGADVPGQIVFNVLLGFVLTSPFIAWGQVIRARREVVASLRDRAERAEAEATLRADQIRSREREHIAREMHDVLAHRITLLSLHAGALEVRPDMAAEQIAATAGIIRSSAHQALEDLREILGVLRPGQDSTVRPQQGIGDIATLAAEATAAGARVELDDRVPVPADAPPSTSRTAYRIVQEGLTNARKHAPGTCARVLLDLPTDGELRVSISNPLGDAGAAPAVPGSRSGLVGLTERVQLTGGRIDYGARRGPDGGIDFRLEARLPWPT